MYQVSLNDASEPLGPPVRLTTGLDAHTIHLAPDGAQLAYSVFTTRQNIWSIRIPDDGPVSSAEARPVTNGNQAIEDIGVSPDGQWLVFDSNRSGNQDIYKMPITGGEPVQLTTHPADDFVPSWSPDGQEIAFYSFRNGNRDIYVMSAEGESLQQLTHDPAEEGYPDWSPDGQQIVFHRLGVEGGLYIIAKNKQDAAWGSPQQLTYDEGAVPRWSPNGKMIAYSDRRRDNLRVFSTEDGHARILVQPQELVTIGFLFPEWSTDSQTVYYKMFDEGGRSNIWSIPATGGPPRLLVQFDDPSHPSPRHQFATDGERFYFTLTESESDIWVMELLAEE